MNVPERGLYARFAPVLSLAFACALIWAHLASVSAAFSILSGFFLAHLMIHVIVGLSAPGRAPRDDFMDIPHVGDLTRRAPTLIKKPAAQPWQDRGPAANGPAPKPPANRPLTPSSTASPLVKPAAPVPPKPAPVGKPAPPVAPKPVAIDEGAIKACLAIRNDGSACTYDARLRSKYCTAHQGYRPKKAPVADIKSAKVPVQVAAPPPVKARKPAEPKPARETAPIPQASPEHCSAMTKKGAPCRNVPKTGGPLCGIHAKLALKA